MDLEALQQRLQQALGPEFTVGPLLGQGGFAAVFRVRDTSLNRDVAVKVPERHIPLRLRTGPLAYAERKRVNARERFRSHFGDPLASRVRALGS